MNKRAVAEYNWLLLGALDGAELAQYCKVLRVAKFSGLLGLW